MVDFGRADVLGGHAGGLGGLAVGLGWALGGVVAGVGFVACKWLMVGVLVAGLDGGLAGVLGGLAGGLGGLAGGLGWAHGGGVGCLGCACSCVGILAFCSARSFCISPTWLRFCSAWSVCSDWPSGKCSSTSMLICSAPHCVPRLLGVNIGTI